VRSSAERGNGRFRRAGGRGWWRNLATQRVPLSWLPGLGTTEDGHGTARDGGVAGDGCTAGDGGSGTPEWATVRDGGAVGDGGGAGLADGRMMDERRVERFDFFESGCVGVRTREGPRPTSEFVLRAP
jgi:hypothetical protein